MLIEDDIKACDDDNDALTIATSISVAMTDNELLNDALTISTIDCEIEELNVVILALLADIDVANDELKLVIDATLPLKVSAIEELIEEDIKFCDADNDALTIAISKSVAITDNELLNDALTISIIDADIEELNVVILALLADIDVAIDELNMVSEA